MSEEIRLRPTQCPRCSLDLRTLHHDHIWFGVCPSEECRMVVLLLPYDISNLPLAKDISYRKNSFLP